MCEAVVIGVSKGGLAALSKILPYLPASFPMPIIIVQHRLSQSDNFLIEYFTNLCKMKIKEAEMGDAIKVGYIYFSPGGYHLLIERDKTLSLNVDEPVSYAIPSIDVLFETAVWAYEEKLIGVILTGANSDGSRGLRKIKINGGITIVQSPQTAEAPTMPESAIKITEVDFVLPLEEMAKVLIDLASKRKK